MQDGMLQVPFRAGSRKGRRRRVVGQLVAMVLLGGLIVPGLAVAESDVPQPVKAMADPRPSGFVESGRDALRTFVGAWQLPSERMLGSVVNGTRLRHPVTAEQPRRPE